MTPKKKAEELFFKFNKKGLHQISSIIYRVIRKEMIKQCALIAVDEILKSHDELIDCFKEPEDYIKIENYWQEVKQEILNL